MANSDVTYESGNVDLFRFGQTYTVRQAARLAVVSPATVRRWLKGYEAPGHQMAPVFGTGDTQTDKAPGISFLQLVEIVVVAQFRRGGNGRQPIKLERLRQAHAYARRAWKLAYPFASLNLREFGGHVLHQFDVTDPHGASLALDIDGQWVLPGTVTNALERFDFSDADRLAQRWFPAGRQVPIVVDPRVSAGRPTIVGRSVTLDIIRRRFEAGQSIEFIGRDFGLSRNVVEEAIRYADRYAVTAA